MKALVVAPQPFFSPRGTPLSVYYRAMVMSEMGVEIDLLTYGQGQDVELPGVRIVRIPGFAFLGPVKVGPSLLKLFLDGFLLIWTLVLCSRQRYDVVHAHEESVFFCRFLKPVFQFKLIYDMHSSLPQQLTNFRYTKSRLLIGLFAWLEDTCLAHADAVITICPELAKYAVGRMADPSRHVLIENSIFDPVRLKGGDREGAGIEAWESQIPRDRPIVSYAGTLENYQGIDLLVSSFGRVRAARPDAFLLMIGGEPAQVERYRDAARREHLDGHCLFTGQVERSVAQQLLERADILTSPRIEGNNTPLKVYEQLASGKPLVATRILSHTQVLNEEVCFLADPTTEAMADAILSALDDEPCRRRVVHAAQELYNRQYSRRAYEEKIGGLLAILS